MSQINITLEFNELVELFTKDRNEAMACLLKKVLDAVLIAESEEQIGAARYERSENSEDLGRHGNGPGKHGKI